MRGSHDTQPPLFHRFCVEDRIRADHPLRDGKRPTDRILADMSPAFDAASSNTGRPSVPPERLLKALLLVALYSVRSERQLCEQIDLGLLFRLDGTIIESFASAKSFQPKPVDVDRTNGDNDKLDIVETDSDKVDSNGFKPRNVDVDFRGQKRTNETHASRTDPEARLYRKSKGKEAKLSHMGHVLAENRHGPILGGDKGYDDGEYFRKLESRKIEPHIPLVGEPADPKSVKDRKRLPGIRARRRMKRRMGEVGYELSQKCRKKVEECVGWLKSVAGLGRSRVVGRWKLVQLLQIGAAAFNLVRLRELSPAT